MYVVFLHTIPALAGTGLGDTGTGTAWVEKSLSVPIPVVPVSVYLPGIPYPCRSLGPAWPLDSVRAAQDCMFVLFCF